MTVLIHATHADSNLVNIPPLYLLAVQAVAVLIGSRAAIVASVLAFLCFDWFFVEPRYQFTVRDPFEFISLCVFLVTAILVGQLTGVMKTRAQQAHKRELTTAALAKASWAVASELNLNAALSQVVNQLAFVDSIEESAIYLRTADAGCRQVASYIKQGSTPSGPVGREGLVLHALDSGQPAPPEASRYALIPIRVDDKVTAVMYLQIQEGSLLMAEDQQVVKSLTNHVAVVLQRDKLMSEQTKSHALAEADRLKTALLQMVSHDFRSPLASIKAGASSLKVAQNIPVDSEKQREILETIEHEADRLNRMVGNILNLSRLEADAWRPKRDVVAASELVGSTLDSFSHDDNIRIRTNVDQQAELDVDFTQIMQVLRNLLENALKYSPLPVELTVHSQLNSVSIEVLDRGPGLVEADRERIFEPFYRASQHQESGLPGLGVGLAVCRGLVEANGGKLTASNRTGGGAAFRIDFPNECANKSGEAS